MSLLLGGAGTLLPLLGPQAGSSSQTSVAHTGLVAGSPRQGSDCANSSPPPSRRMKQRHGWGSRNQKGRVRRSPAGSARDVSQEGVKAQKIECKCAHVGPAAPPSADGPSLCVWFQTLINTDPSQQKPGARPQHSRFAWKQILLLRQVGSPTLWEATQSWF